MSRENSAVTMGRKTKKPETADAQKKDFVKRNVEAVRKESTVQNFEIRGMECESSTSVGGGEKNNTRTIEVKETTTVEVENSMEQAMEKDNSEGEIILKEEKKRSRKISSSSAEISVRDCEEKYGKGI